MRNLTLDVLVSGIVMLMLAGCSDDQKATEAARADTRRQEGTFNMRAGDNSESGTSTETSVSRWFDAERVERGAVVFAENCAACHGKGGEGAFTWRKRGPDGKFPPPPLDGSGHAWHHPIRALGTQIKFGAPGGGGSMPKFSATLTDDEVLDAIAWFQSRWSDEIYAAWYDIELRSQTADQ